MSVGHVAACMPAGHIAVVPHSSIVSARTFGFPADHACASEVLPNNHDYAHRPLHAERKASSCSHSHFNWRWAAIVQFVPYPSKHLPVITACPTRPGRRWMSADCDGKRHGRHRIHALHTPAMSWHRHQKEGRRAHQNIINRVQQHSHSGTRCAYSHWSVYKTSKSKLC